MPAHCSSLLPHFFLKSNKQESASAQFILKGEDENGKEV